MLPHVVPRCHAPLASQVSGVLTSQRRSPGMQSFASADAPSPEPSFCTDASGLESPPVPPRPPPRRAPPRRPPVPPPPAAPPPVPPPPPRPPAPPAPATPVVPPAPATPVVPPAPATPVVPPAPATPVVPPAPAIPVVPPAPAAPVVPPAPAAPVVPPAPVVPDVPAESGRTRRRATAAAVTVAAGSTVGVHGVDRPAGRQQDERHQPRDAHEAGQTIRIRENHPQGLRALNRPGRRRSKRTNWRYWSSS